MEIITTIFASLVLALLSVAGLVGYLVYQNSRVLASNKQGRTLKVTSNESVEIVQNSWCRKALNEASTHCCHLFDYIVKSQGKEEWGTILDAGTGSHSLDWLLDLQAKSITAVTGDPKRQASMERMFSSRLRADDVVVAGNWKDPKFLQGKVYDVVLADYLLGSIDAFAPYFQDRLFERLKPHVGKKLYFVGAEPFPDKDESPHGQLIIDIAKTRDACILLAGDRPYREYPLDWVIRSLKKSGYKVESFGYFETTYSQEYVETQINVAETKLARFSNESLADVMQSQLDKLRSKVLRTTWGIKWGSDYVVVASPIRHVHQQEMVNDVPIKSPVQEQAHIFPIDEE